jgi:hypothetical protein
MKQEDYRGDYYGGFNKKNKWVEYKTREEALKNGIKADEMSVIPYKDSLAYDVFYNQKSDYLKAYNEILDAADAIYHNNKEPFSILSSAENNAGDTYGSSFRDIDVHKAKDWYYTFIGSIVSQLSDNQYSKETIEFFKSFGIEA